MIRTLLPVALGGALGAMLRYLATLAVGTPIATLMVNVLGSFAMGLLFVLLAGRPGAGLFLMTGVLGGFTTFSAFSLDAMKLWQAGQGGQAAAYVLASVLLSLAGVAAGAAVARGIGA